MGFGTIGARIGALCVIGLTLTGGGALADDIYPSQLQTDDLRLIYYDPIQTYLAPYVGRAFENSFAFMDKVQ